MQNKDILPEVHVLLDEHRLFILLGAQPPQVNDTLVFRTCDRGIVSFTVVRVVRGYRVLERELAQPIGPHVVYVKKVEEDVVICE